MVADILSAADGCAPSRPLADALRKFHPDSSFMSCPTFDALVACGSGDSDGTGNFVEATDAGVLFTCGCTGTPAPVPASPSTSTLAPSATGQDAGDGRSEDKDTTTIVAGAISAAVAAALILVGFLCLRRTRRATASKQGRPPPPEACHGNSGGRGSDAPPLPPYHGSSPQGPDKFTVSATAARTCASLLPASVPPVAPVAVGAVYGFVKPKAPASISTSNVLKADRRSPPYCGSSPPTPPDMVTTVAETADENRVHSPSRAVPPRVPRASGGAEIISTEAASSVTNSTGNISTEERIEFAHVFRGRDVAHGSFGIHGLSPEAGEGGGTEPAVGSGRSSAGGVGVARAVIEAALDLAQQSPIIGVSEAATLVAILVDLVANSRESLGGGEERLKRCRAIVVLLQRAGKVLGKVRGAVLYRRHLGRSRWNPPKACANMQPWHVCCVDERWFDKKGRFRFAAANPRLFLAHAFRELESER